MCQEINKKILAKLRMKQYQVARNKIDMLLETEVVAKAPTPYLQKILRQVFDGGKRLRPIIALEIMNNFQKESKNIDYNIYKLILVPELIHSASLIIDDLPCMDNDKYRRSNYTIHYQYGETVAQVIVFYLLSRVYCLMYEDLEMLRESKLPDFDTRRELIFECLSDNLGVTGAAHGQYLDTYKLPSNPILATQHTSKYKQHLKDLLIKKTATFFEISFVISYIAMGGDLNHLSDIRRLAQNFGFAFQISDDFQDQESDAKRSFCPNYVNHIGLHDSISTFNDHIYQCKELLIKYRLHSKIYDELFELIQARVPKN